MVNTISSANQDKLISALDSAMDRYNQGGTPSSAVAKAASDSGLNSNYTRRLTEMFNAALTLDHLDTYRLDGSKRAGGFPLADFTEVWSEMRRTPGSQPVLFAKAAAIKDHSNDVVTNPVPGWDWGTGSVKAASVEPPADDESFSAKVARARLVREKQAAERAALYDKLEAEYSKRSIKVAEARAAADRARLNYHGHKEKLASVMEALSSKLRRVDSCDWDTFKSAALNAYPGTEDVLDTMLTKFPVVKRAGYVNRDFSRVGEALDLFKRVVTEVKSAAEAFGMFKKAESELTAWLTSGIPTNALKSMAPEYTEVRPTNFFKRLAALEGYANLSQLMLTDPVIGEPGVKPKTVKRLYKELSKVNPSIGQQSIALRGFLRRGLQSSPDEWGKSLDTFEVDQLADMRLGSGGKDSWEVSSPKKAAEIGYGAGIGAGLGAGGGLLYSLMTSQVGDDWKDHLRRTAIGAGLGGAAGAGVTALAPRGESAPGKPNKNKEAPFVAKIDEPWRQAARTGTSAASSGILGLIANGLPDAKGRKKGVGAASAAALGGAGELINQRLLGGTRLGSDIVTAGTGALAGAASPLTQHPYMNALTDLLAKKIPGLKNMPKGTAGRIVGGTIGAVANPIMSRSIDFSK